MIYYFTSYRCEKHLIVMSYQNHNYETEMREGSLFCSFEIDRPRRGGSRTALHVNKYVHRRYPGSSRTAPTKWRLIV